MKNAFKFHRSHIKFPSTVYSNKHTQWKRGPAENLLEH